MTPTFPYQQLSVPQRLDLIAEIWDSIPDEAESLDVPDWHREEVERRIADADANPQVFSSWEEVKARLRTKT